MNWFKRAIKNWFQTTPATDYGAVVFEDLGHETEVFRNRIWYRGKASELTQFYSQIDDLAGNNSFWASSSRAKVRKIHSGMPGLIVDTLSDIVVNDFLGVSSVDRERLLVWEKIAAENNFNHILNKAVRSVLALGDGAFKICFDPEVSALPVIEFFEADKVRFTHKRGKISEIIFLTVYKRGQAEYLLEEIYHKDGVKYRLLGGGEEVPLTSLEETSGLLEIRHGENRRKFLMAAPLIFDFSPKFDGRGKSVFDSKIDAFDGIDEILSQWIDALRDGRVVKYIPSNFLPRNPDTGEIINPNGFESRYVETDADLSENSSPKVQVVQPDIRTDALSASYINFLDIAISGIIAPSTLGIDIKKLDNAEAQREKEKATLYTRNRIIRALQEVLPNLVKAAVWTFDGLYGNEDLDFTCKAEFGEYANPSFEAQVETIGKARQMGIMSIENSIEQLYGQAMSKEQKEEEVSRIKGENSGRMQFAVTQTQELI